MPETLKSQRVNSLQKLPFLLGEIGLPSLTSYAFYSIKKKFGFFRSSRLTQNTLFENKLDENKFIPLNCFDFGFDSKIQVTPLGSADEIADGYFHPFCGEKAKLDFHVPLPLQEWESYSDIVSGKDIKEIWEPARFCWALMLIKEYAATMNNRYLEAFWRYFDEFTTANPPYLGPNWVSAQEAAIRSINWLLILPVIKNAQTSTRKRLSSLRHSLWQHFLRLPVTLDYAKSQNNNHLLSESLTLFMLGNYFAPQSSFARKWKKQGAALFEQTLLEQISQDGTYCQHSANYHRLMLHLALIYEVIQRNNGLEISAAVRKRLAVSTSWLAACLDPISGRVSNLGHNDGSLLLPFGSSEYADYRPTLQAASMAFCGVPALPAGPWDELSRLLNLPAPSAIEKKTETSISSSTRIGSSDIWASLRAVHFYERPGHADQLHVEIWWDGINIAGDPGTFAYNKEYPWQNSLMATRVHNTVTVDGKDQMLRAGKFLWLKRAQAVQMPQTSPHTLSASHNGYKDLGVIHTRTVRMPADNTLQVEDHIEYNKSNSDHLISIHWLLPDWEWHFENNDFWILEGKHKAVLSISAKSFASGNSIEMVNTSLIRAGETLFGNTSDEILGWTSPTYGVKVPALSLTRSWHSSESFMVTTSWQFMEVK